jgi:chaperonin GroEL
MEYNQPSAIVKDLSFGADANEKIMSGVEKLANAVRSTLGASGKCVIYEDAMGKPIITKDGVTVAESVILYDPVENMGATLIKEAAKNTVKEAGDGTTTSTVLAHSLLNKSIEALDKTNNIRELQQAFTIGVDFVCDYLDKNKLDVTDDMLTDVATISTNNDIALGNIIANAYKKVGKHGVVLMEESETEETYFEVVDGIQFDSGLKSPHLTTNEDKDKSELEEPFVLIVASPIPNIRKIQAVLEHVIKSKRSLLIVAQVEQQPMSALLTNKVKGNIKVNVVDLPGFGSTKRDTLEDLASLTGAKIIDEQLGDDLDLIDPEVLGTALKSVTDSKNTVLTIESVSQEALDRIDGVKKKIKEEQNPFLKKKLEQRLAMLSGSVGIIKVGANSKIELKEKKDRVEDAIYATKAALQEGIVPGGGVALLNAAQKMKVKNSADHVFRRAILAPFSTILENAGIELPEDFNYRKGWGINVVNGKPVNMIKAGIIDPVLVTKTALKNAVSVVSTIISADCVISNMRTNASDQ